MSWQVYVDKNLVGSGHVDKGAIISLAGDSVWAATPGFQLQGTEGQDLNKILTQAFWKESDGEKLTHVDKARQEGLHIEGQRYIVISFVDDRTLYARGAGEERKQEGVICVKTKQAILIAHYTKNMVAQNTSQTVLSLADYLSNLGY